MSGGPGDHDPWHAWRWAWEYVGLCYMRDEFKAKRVSAYWLSYLSVGERWAVALLGPRIWREPKPTPPVDVYARWRAAGMP